MRFFDKTPPPPEHKDRRQISYYAWFPVKIGKETRWLETVYIEQIYFKRKHEVPFGVRSKWENHCFI